MNEIVIRVSGDAKDLQPAIDKLEQLGEVDKANAAQFKKSQTDYETAAAKRQKLLEEEKEDLIELRKRKQEAYSVEEIQKYNKSIKDTEARIKLLQEETTGTATSMNKVVNNTNKFGESVKKSYGFLRLAANVIPGLGISGIIMLGYEGLAALVEKMSEDFTVLQTKQTEFNTVGIQSTTEHAAVMKKFREEIELLIIQQNILNGTQSELDLKNQQLINSYGKDVAAIKEATLKKKTTLMEAMSELDKERNRILEESRQKGLTGLLFGEGEDYEKKKAEFDKKTAEIGEKFKQLGEQQRDEEAAAYKKLLEGRALIRAEEEAKHRKSIRDISVQELENQKKTIDAQYKIDVLAAKREIDDKLELDAKIYDLTQKREMEILYLNEEIARKKRDQERKIAFLTITDAKLLSDKLYNIELAYNDRVSGLRNDYYESRRVADAEYYEQVMKDLDALSDKEAKQVQDDLQRRIRETREAERIWGDQLKTDTTRRYNEGLMSKKEYDRQILKDDIAMQEFIMYNEDKTSKEYVAAEKQKQDDLRALRELEKKERKDDLKEVANDTKVMLKFILDMYENMLEENIKYIDHRQDMQKQAINEQEALAIAGKENTLAFEKKQQSELEKMRMEEQRKLKRAKELEIFLNSLAEFSKDDPKNALGKALALMATAVAAEATFAEDGGIIGQIKERSYPGRRHKGGGDVLVHAQVGEGMFSRKEVQNLGGAGAFMAFKQLLGRGPITEKPIPLTGVAFGGGLGYDPSRLEKKVDQLNETMKNKRELDIEFESMHNMFSMIVTQTERGVRDKTKYELKRRSIRG